VLFSVTTIYKNLNALCWRLVGGGVGIQVSRAGERRWSGGGLFSNTMFYHGILLREDPQRAPWFMESNDIS
jgi:hypothetical protein